MVEAADSILPFLVLHVDCCKSIGLDLLLAGSNLQLSYSLYSVYYIAAWLRRNVIEYQSCVASH